MSTFPKRPLFYKLIGTFVTLCIFTSMALISAKVCHFAAVTESEMLELKTPEDTKKFVSNYYMKLHVFHTLSVICGFSVVLFAFIDLVPDFNDDLRFAFHFVSIFVMGTISLLTLIASYVAFYKPCREEGTCCSVFHPTKVGPESPSAPSAFSEKDKIMIAVTILDCIAGICLLIITVTYFIDIRKQAKQTGYLSRINNGGYLRPK